MDRLPPSLGRALAILLIVSCSGCASTQLARPGENKTLVTRIFQAIDAGELEIVQQSLASDFKLHYQGIPDPIPSAGLLGAIREYYTAFPDNQHQIHDLIAEGDRVVVRLVQHATHRGTFEGAQPTGKAISVAAIHILRISNGRIAEWWVAEDDLGLRRQLGLVP